MDILPISWDAMIRDLARRIDATTASLRRVEYMMRANVRRLSAKPPVSDFDYSDTDSIEEDTSYADS